MTQDQTVTPRSSDGSDIVELHVIAEEPSEAPAASHEAAGVSTKPTPSEASFPTRAADVSAAGDASASAWQQPVTPIQAVSAPQAAAEALSDQAFHELAFGDASSWTHPEARSATAVSMGLTVPTAAPSVAPSATVVSVAASREPAGTPVVHVAKEAATIQDSVAAPPVASQVSATPDAACAPNALHTPDLLNVPNTPDVSDVLDASGVSDASGSLGVPGTLDASDSLSSPEPLGTLEASAPSRTPHEAAPSSPFNPVRGEATPASAQTEPTASTASSGLEENLDEASIVSLTEPLTMTGSEPPQTPPPPPDGGTGAANEDDNDKPMTLLDHLGELRKRLVLSFVGMGIGFLACYGFAQKLFFYLSLPLLQVMPQDSKFIYTGVAEAFFVDLKVSFVAGLFVACPYLFYQIWAFIAPGLYEEEKRYMIPLALCSALFFIGGAAFCYFVVFPFAFTFFMSYSTDSIVAMLSINEYLSFALKMLVAFGLIFEMPLFAFFLARMGLITGQKMREVRKYAVLGVFIIAAILTPPDVFSQLLMACPMLILYELSIYVALMVQKKQPKPAEASGEQA